METPASSLRDAFERIALVGLGAASFSADRAEEIAAALAERGLVRREDLREVAEELRERLRGDAGKVAARAGEGVSAVLTQLGVGSGLRDERVDELELRLAQLEHRLRLVEGGTDRPA